MSDKKDKKKCHAELVSASSPHVVLKDKLQAWKISNQAHNDTTNFTSGLHPTYNNTNAWGRSDVSPTIASVRQRGFTLIELLVVVLIIGILAAVALPQYNKAVERSKATQALTLLKAVAQAQTEYYLANGSYTQHFDDLSIDIPLTGNTKVIAAAQDTKSDGNWSLQLEDATASGYNFNVYMLRTNGKYQGAGFQILLQSPSGANLNPQIRCLERKTGAIITFDSSLPAGAYCEKIIHAPTLTGDGTFERIYPL